MLTERGSAARRRSGQAGAAAEGTGSRRSITPCMALSNASSLWCVRRRPSRTIAAKDLVQHGSVFETVPAEQLYDAAMKVAGEIAAKDPRVIRAAKAALNGIDPVDVNRSYRFEQGFTFELNLSGAADEHRDAFVETGENLNV